MGTRRPESTSHVVQVYMHQRVQVITAVPCGERTEMRQISKENNVVLRERCEVVSTGGCYQKGIE